MRISVLATEVESDPYGLPSDASDLDTILEWARTFCTPGVAEDRVKRKAAFARLRSIVPNLEPFGRWNGRVVYQNDLSRNGRDAEMAWTFWVVDRLAQGWTNRNIRDRALHWIETNSALMHEIYVISGFSVASSHQLAPGLALFPKDAVRKTKFSEQAFERNGPLDSGERCALCVQYLLSPMSGPPLPPGDLGMDLAFYPPRLLRERVVRNVRRALIIASDGPVELPSYLAMPEADDYPNDQTYLISGFYGPAVRQETKVDLGLATTAFKDIETLGQSEAFELACDRLATARLAEGASKAIDLGMALEIILRHSEPESTEEISPRLRRRAALLLAPTGRSARSVKDQVYALYAARSDGVHRGTIRPEANSGYDEKESDALVASLLKVVLSNGMMPDWSALDPGHAPSAPHPMG